MNLLRNLGLFVLRSCCHPLAEREGYVNLLRNLGLSVLLLLSLHVTAIPEEFAVKGDLPAVDLTAIVRPNEAPLAGNQSIDRFTLDVSLQTAQKRLLDPNAVGWQEAAMFLATVGEGRFALEEIIIHFRMTDNARWTDAFCAYTTVVRPEEVSERMIPEYVADLQMQPIGKQALAALKRIGDLGPRARSALPALEWAMSFSHDEEQMLAAEDAILKVRGRVRGRMTGC
jgi:hypothetical protein